MRLVLAFALSIVCSAQLSAPLIGYVRTSARELRPVYGVAGAFVLGDALDRDVLSASFTSKAGLAKKESELIVYRDGKVVIRHPAPPGPATFSFTDTGEPARVHFEDDTCAAFHQDRLTPCGAAFRLRQASARPADEQISDHWSATHTDTGIVLHRKSSDETWRLPEAAK